MSIGNEAKNDPLFRAIAKHYNIICREYPWKLIPKDGA